ncbi:putative glycine-rich cell wall structural protein 1 [Ceratitis capitata]|uniref:putative glycine-rich cell wall structural protein 1 n=1 Tax=Ceratitis capitata TaxID=7213 RepID=UPI000618803C|nr:putative glycine-rich cell wall structural protein 1 [Ceratitis capitata]
MRTLIWITLVFTILAALLHSSNAQMPLMPGAKGIMSRARRAAQGGGEAGGSAGAGISFGVGANMGGGWQGSGGGQGGR